MRASAIVVCSIVGLSPVFGLAQEAWIADRACNTKSIEFTLAERAGCDRAMCAQLDAGRICACIHDVQEQTVFTMESTHGARSVWATPHLPYMGGESSLRAEEVSAADPSGSQVLVGLMSALSVGIGISRWEVWATSEQGVSKTLEVEDFGLMSFMTRAQGAPQCRLFAARWQSGWEHGRGDGLYVVGRWYDVGTKSFELAPGRPVLYRRYLHGLERERQKASAHGEPLLWFKAADTKATRHSAPF